VPRKSRSQALGRDPWRTRASPSLECPKQDQDIVLLIDGSGSITAGSFATMMNFVRAVMSQFRRSSAHAQVCPWGREASLQGIAGEVLGP
jgi:hypothetical protein